MLAQGIAVSGNASTTISNGCVIILTFYVKFMKFEILQKIVHKQLFINK
jgi:hypothetical protein